MSEKFKSIQCYGANAWFSYQAGALGEVDRSAMEEHLLTCENCLEVYLNMMEDRLKNDGASRLGEDFSNRVLEIIEQEGYTQKTSAAVGNVVGIKEKEVRNNKINLLISYCAAASIVLFFWAGGFLNDVGRLTDRMEFRIQSEEGLIQTGWTQKIIEEKPISIIEKLIPKKE